MRRLVAVGASDWVTFEGVTGILGLTAENVLPENATGVSKVIIWTRNAKCKGKIIFGCSAYDFLHHVQYSSSLRF